METVFIVAVGMVLSFMAFIFLIASRPVDQEEQECNCNKEQQQQPNQPPYTEAGKQEFYDVMSHMLESGVISYQDFDEMQTKMLPYL